MLTGLHQELQMWRNRPPVAKWCSSQQPERRTIRCNHHLRRNLQTCCHGLCNVLVKRIICRNHQNPEEEQGVHEPLFSSVKRSMWWSQMQGFWTIPNQMWATWFCGAVFAHQARIMRIRLTLWEFTPNSATSCQSSVTKVFGARTLPSNFVTFSGVVTVLLRRSLKNVVNLSQRLNVSTGVWGCLPDVWRVTSQPNSKWCVRKFIGPAHFWKAVVGLN